MSLLFRSLPTVALRSKPCPLTCLPFYFFNFHINSRPTSLIISPPRRPLSSSSSSSTSVVVTDNRIPLSPPPNTTDALQWVSRNQYCGELTENDVGKRVRLCGWVALHRIHGGLTFINLRDQTGIVQITTLPDDFPDAHSTMNGLRLEYVVAIEGVVRPRPAESVNKKMKTGTIEMSSNIILLNRVVKLLRRYLEDVHDFVEVSGIFSITTFKVFSDALASGGNYQGHMRAFWDKNLFKYCLEEGDLYKAAIKSGDCKFLREH